jgi:hypothetical protein
LLRQELFVPHPLRYYHAYDVSLRAFLHFLQLYQLLLLLFPFSLLAPLSFLFLPLLFVLEEFLQVYQRSVFSVL